MESIQRTTLPIIHGYYYSFAYPVVVVVVFVVVVVVVVFVVIVLLSSEKQAVRNKQMRERFEQMNKWTREWPRTYPLIIGCCEP